MSDVRLQAEGAAPLQLLPEHAAWIEGEDALLVADVHLGKAETFRTLGVPVPAAATAGTLQRLDALIASRRPARLVVLGDLLHGPVARRPEALARLSAWRAAHAGVAITLVRGNHDDRAGDPPPEVGIELVDGPWRLGGWQLAHAPMPEPEPASASASASVAASGARTGCPAYVCGHLHPAIRLGDGVASLRRPCFWAGRAGVVLPAFGEFTGGWPVRRAPGDRVFVSDGSRVLEVPAAPPAAAGRRRR